MSIGEQELKAAIRVIKKGPLSGFLGRAGKEFLGGKYVRRLEELFCRYFKVKYAVSFNSASTALQAAVGAIGLKLGDEVITTPFTMPVNSAAILLNNAIPVFIDIEEDTFNVNPELVEGLITPKTRAVLTVNLFGGSVDYDPILRIAKKHNLKIIEDNAQSPGATYKGRHCGTIGDMGVFSFNVHKVIQCGEGGVLVTNNKKYAFRAQLIRNHGEVVIDGLYDDKRIYEPVLGSNYRLAEIPAAIAIEQFKKLDKLNKQRIDLADYLTRKLKQFNWLIPPKTLGKSRHVYYVYPLRFLEKKSGRKRADFVKAMKAEGFELFAGYQKPIYLMPLYQRKDIFPLSSYKTECSKGICPVAERMYEKEILFTTICQPPNTRKEIDLFVEAVRKYEEGL